jgi:hypothetical protein
MTPETANEMTQFGEIEVVRNVTLPFIIIPADGVPFYVKFNTAIEPDKTTFSERVRKGKVSADGTQQSAEPMHIAEVTNLQSGEVGRLVAHQVLESNLDEAYPNAGYVGKYFKISKQKSAKRYFTFNIVEIKMKTKSEDQIGAKKR